MDTELETLRKKILDFVKDQPGYDQEKYENLDICFEDREDHLVILGTDLMTGMAGMGDTPNSAYEDFVKKWNELNGFEWIEKNNLQMQDRV